MTVDPGPVDPAPWLPLADVLAELRVTAGTPDAAAADRARVAAASYVERHRRDLLVPVGDGTAFAPDAAVRHGALLLAARLYARRSSPAGLASYAEFGPAPVLRLDPDVERLLGLGRHGRPVAR